MLGCWVFPALYDLVTRIPITPFNSPQFASSSRGIASFNPNPTSGVNGWTVRNTPLVSRLPSYSIIAGFQASPQSNTGRPFYCERAVSGSDIVKLQIADGAGNVNQGQVVYRDDAGDLARPSVGDYVIADGRYHTFAMTKVPGAIAIFNDGQPDSVNPLTTGTLTDPSVCTIGYDIQDSVNSCTPDYITHIYLYPRALSNTEMAWVAAEPFVMLRPSVRRSYYSPISQQTASIVETGTSSDHPAAIATFHTAIDEAGTTTDGLATALQTTSTIEETGASVVATSAVQHTTTTVAEIGVSTDSFVATLEATSAINETGSSSVAVSASQQATRPVSESRALSDTVAATHQTMATANEAATTLEGASVAQIAGAKVMETLAALTAPDASWTAVETVSETGATTASQTISAQTVLSVAETSAAADQTDRGVSSQRMIAEIGDLADTVAIFGELIGTASGSSTANAVSLIIGRLLYPYLFFNPILAAEEPQPLPAGNLALIPLDLSTVQMMKIVLAQASYTEDYGMHAWISRYPAGQSLLNGIDVFPVMRMMPRPVILYVNGPTPPDAAYLAPVEPGAYYLNVLNLTNTMSRFSFSQTNLA